MMIDQPWDRLQFEELSSFCDALINVHLEVARFIKALSYDDLSMPDAIGFRDEEHEVELEPALLQLPRARAAFAREVSPLVERHKQTISYLFGCPDLEEWRTGFELARAVESLFDENRPSREGQALIDLESQCKKWLQKSITYTRSARRYEVFLSYSHADKVQAMAIERRIKSLGARVFRDEAKILPGAEFPEAIRTALSASAEVWLIASKSIINSDWVRTECGAAWGLQKTIVPVLLDLSHRELPAHLASTQTCDIKEVESVLLPKVEQNFALFARIERHVPAPLRS